MSESERRSVLIEAAKERGRQGAVRAIAEMLAEDRADEEIAREARRIARGSRGAMKQKWAYGITLAIGAALVLAKLCGVIEAAWWWVTMPLWVPCALAAAVTVTAAVMVTADDLRQRVARYLQRR